MPYVKCQICEKEFYTKPRSIKLGWGKYCSKKCQFISQRNGITTECSSCGKSVYRTKKEISKSKSQRYFCNKSCLAIWKNRNMPSGEDHPNWKDGSNAYRSILLKSGKKPICTECDFDDKRVLVVHHVDHNRKNNKKNNLIWMCRNCHYLEHY